MCTLSFTVRLQRVVRQRQHLFLGLAIRGRICYQRGEAEHENAEEYQRPAKKARILGGQRLQNRRASIGVNSLNRRIEDGWSERLESNNPSARQESYAGDH